MMIANTAATALAGVLFAILQSTLISKIIPISAIPDLSLLILIASAWRYGSMTGEIAGFFIGICLDAMGLAPLGFHAFTYTLIGYLFGRLQDNISPGPFFLPILAAVVATILKYGGSLLLALVFGLNSGAVRYISFATVWEILFNAVLAPLIFFTVLFIARITEGRRSGFQ